MVSKGFVFHQNDGALQFIACNDGQSVESFHNDFRKKSVWPFQKLYILISIDLNRPEMLVNLERVPSTHKALFEGVILGEFKQLRINRLLKFQSWVNQFKPDQMYCDVKGRFNGA